MKTTHTKLKATSAVLGPLAALWIISLAPSYSSLTPHEALLRIGASLICIALALEPEILFQPLPSSVKEAGSRPPPFRSPLVSALSKGSQLCFLLAGIAWLAS